ncbi:hypothetical protein SNEBB_008079, partial [Seison nebaliae]
VISSGIIYGTYVGPDYDVDIIVDEQKILSASERRNFCASENSNSSTREMWGDILYNNTMNDYQWAEHPFLHIKNDCELWGEDQPFDHDPPQETIVIYYIPKIWSYAMESNMATVCANVIYKKTVNINLTTEKKRNKSMKHLINGITEGMRKSSLNKPVNCYESKTEDVILENYYFNL